MLLFFLPSQGRTLKLKPNEMVATNIVDICYFFLDHPVIIAHRFVSRCDLFTRVCFYLSCRMPRLWLYDGHLPFTLCPLVFVFGLFVRCWCGSLFLSYSLDFLCDNSISAVGLIFCLIKWDLYVMIRQHCRGSSFCSVSDISDGFVLVIQCCRGAVICWIRLDCLLRSNRCCSGSSCHISWKMFCVRDATCRSMRSVGEIAGHDWNSL